MITVDITLTQKIYNISSLITGIGSIFLGVFVYSKNKKTELNRRYLFMSLIASLWSFSLFLWGISTDYKIALLWAKVLHFWATFLPATFLHFILEFLGLSKKKKKILIFAYIISAIIALTAPTTLFIKGVEDRFLFKLWPVPGVIYPFYLLLFFICLSYAFYLSFKSFKQSEGFLRQQLKYIITGGIVSFVGGATNYFLFYNIRIIPYGNAFVFLYILIYAYAIIKYRLMDIRIAFTRAGIFLVVYAFVLGIPFILLRNTGSGLLSTSAAVILATIGPIIYLFLQRKAENVLLAQQRRYQRILLQAATGMVSEHNLIKLSKLIVYILNKTIKLNFTAIFIINKEKNIFQLEAIRGQSAIDSYEQSFDCKNPFIAYLQAKREPSSLEEMPINIKDSFNLLNKSKIVIPAFTGDELLGFVLLGEKLNTQHYTDEDMGVFKILSRQSALAIENCVFFKETKESQERMFAAEKLASIGGMADGVAHQIKNRLNQFSVASGELKFEIEDFSSKHTETLNKEPELKTTLDYLNKIANSLIENVKRTDGIIRGILDFARVGNKENFFGKFSLKEVTDLAYNLLTIKHETAKMPITVNLGNDDTIYGIKSQFTEAIYNMLDNAYEATQENAREFTKQKLGPFEPLVELKLTHLPGRDIIKISDNGIGIKEEDKHKIFAPFFTTKSSYKSGSGIGAYVVKRIIEENHKGKIHFTSSYMKGTEFLIELPRSQ